MNETSPATVRSDMEQGRAALLFTFTLLMEEIPDATRRFPPMNVIPVMLTRLIVAPALAVLAVIDTAPAMEVGVPVRVVNETLEMVPPSDRIASEAADAKPLMAMLLTDPVLEPEVILTAPDTTRPFPLTAMLEIAWF